VLVVLFSYYRIVGLILCRLFLISLFLLSNERVGVFSTVWSMAACSFHYLFLILFLERVGFLPSLFLSQSVCRFSIPSLCSLYLFLLSLQVCLVLKIYTIRLNSSEWNLRKTIHYWILFLFFFLINFFGSFFLFFLGVSFVSFSASAFLVSLDKLSLNCFFRNRSFFTLIPGLSIHRF